MASPGIHSCWMAAINFIGLAVAAVALSANAAQVDIPGPLGSGAFGTSVAVLPNGNFVVVDPSGPVSNIGAVYLYDPDGGLISMLTGSNANDGVGNGGVTVLSNGHFVVASPNWDNGSAQNAGAVTWVNGAIGLDGVVSPANSLVGTSASDFVGQSSITALSNGNYVIASQSWNNGATVDAGAVTWASGNTGVVGEITPVNSLVGTSAGSSVGFAVTELSNGHYVVSSPFWDTGATQDVGAVTWGNGLSGVSGPVTALNSLVGTTAQDYIGNSGVTALSNGNYVVASRDWNNGGTVDAGAVTWGDGGTGLSGFVSAANSLVGTSANDGSAIMVTALSDGDYVVARRDWNNGGIADAGAATWANGGIGLSGPVTALNSLVGTKAGDAVGDPGVIALSNGNYVVASSNWDNGGTQNVGAVTWASGATGLSGPISAANSLVGTKAGDRVGSGRAWALSNGNYVVSSPLWDNGATQNVGAVTWASGSTGRIDSVAPRNSLRGTTAEDQVGSSGVTALSNGNYVVSSQLWNNGLAVDAGAVTWGDGAGGITGVVSAANSLIGTTTGDQVGTGGVFALNNGNYVVSSFEWDNGATMDVGAVTWAAGGVGLVGTVSPGNSLVGTTLNDRVSPFGVTPLGDGNYAFSSAAWDFGGLMNAGAVTLGRGDGGLKGAILPANSVLGTAVAGGNTMVFDYDPAREQLVVGRPASNIVTIFTLPPELVFADGFE